MKSFRRIYSIPDLHGRLDLLDKALELLDKAGYDSTLDALVFLGDMGDRGPDSKGVFDLVRKLQSDNPDSVFALRGNHEDIMLQFYQNRTQDNYAYWDYNGGWATLKSYGGSVPDDTLKWIASLPYSLEIQGFFFSHAPVPREKKRTGSPRSYGQPAEGLAGKPYTVHELTWTYFGQEYEFAGGYMDKHEGPLGLMDDPVTGLKTHPLHLIGICGHIHRLRENGKQKLEIRKFNKYRMLDVGCGCAPYAPLAVHECISGDTTYAFPDNPDNK